MYCANCFAFLQRPAELKAERIAELNSTKNELRDAFFRLDNMDLKMAALEIRLNDQDRVKDVIRIPATTTTSTTTTTTTTTAAPIVRQFAPTKIIYQTDEAVVTRQAALESRMNALESLFFASKGRKRCVFDVIFYTFILEHMIDALQP